jgi:hypothetical protein
MMEIPVLEIIDDGLVVELVDRSRWLINPGDWSITIRWLPGQRIQIKEGDGSYTLTNLDTAQPVSVAATKPIAIL